MDVVLALIGLIFSAPLWPVIAIMTKLEAPGSVLYRQVRLGKGRRRFTILKFRTMVADAEAKGPVWSMGGKDPRVTRFGRILRRSRLDELPQLWNILVGEMSFIGPRPERPEFVEQLESQIPLYHLRFAVRPGLTGWAQVNYKYGSSVDDAAKKLEYDLYYVQENSLLLNTRILLRTLETVLLQAGS
jgi:lipopolysaccharide/colanic/teichoic acid biosynthesis glycosyltransferase